MTCSSIKTFQQLCEAVKEQPLGSKHSWICCGTVRSRLVMLLQHDQYVGQQNFFSSTSHHRLQLIQIAFFATECLSFAARNAQTDQDFVNLTNQKNELVKTLVKWRENTLTKIGQSRGIVRILQRIWYWLFDPKKKLDYLNLLKKKDIINLHYSHNCKTGLDLIYYNLEYDLNLFRHPLLFLKIRRIRLNIDKKPNDISIDEARSLKLNASKIAAKYNIQSSPEIHIHLDKVFSAWQKALKTSTA